MFRFRPLVLVVGVDVVPLLFVTGVVVGVQVALQRDRGAGRRIESESARAIFANLHDGDIHDDFRPGLIEIFH